MSDKKESFRVQKLLSSYGYCSRRKAEELIKKGLVKVNGSEIKIGDSATFDDKITVNGKSVKSKSNNSYYIFNKPLGCVTALRDRYHPTIMTYIRPKIKERVMPVGRLDFNTSGLLILTTDGDFANRVMHPSNEVTKTYLVETSEPVPGRVIKMLEGGIPLEDGFTAPAKIRKKTHGILEITIHEGKNRIVRRMFEKMGFKVIQLERVAIGKLKLGDLAEGSVRRLDDKDLKLIFEKA